MRINFEDKNKKGFTLFELLLVILIVATVGGISTIIMVSSLRGSDRTNTINRLRAGGNYAMTQMIKMIKYAQKFEGVATESSPNEFKADCSDQGLTYNYLKIISFDGGSTVFACINSSNMSGSGEVSSNSAKLIDADSVQISSCKITCVRDNFGPPTISIDFTLSAKSGSSFYEKQASIPFHGSVTIRNY